MRVLAITDLICKVLAVLCIIIGIIGMQSSGPSAELAALLPMAFGVLLGSFFAAISVICTTITSIGLIRK